MLRLIAVFAFLLVTVDGLSQEKAKAVITDRSGNTVPLRVPAGGVLYFSAKKSTRGMALESVVWDIEPEEIAERAEYLPVLDPDGTINPLLIVPAGLDSINITVRLFVALADGGDKAKVSVEVEGRGPPKPDVVIPDGEFGLTKFAYNEAMKIISTDRALVAGIIAKNYETAAKEATVDAMTVKLKDLNRSSLTTGSRDVWEQWRAPVTAYMDRLYDEKRAGTPETDRKAYNAIAAGLKLVK